jgi:UDP-glucose 4-epimerase
MTLAVRACLVTGGTGHIDVQVVRKLVGQGEDLVIFDISTNTRFITDVIDKIKFALCRDGM